MIELQNGWVIGEDDYQYMLGHVKGGARKDTGKPKVDWKYFYRDMAGALYKYVRLMEGQAEAGTERQTAMQAAEIVRRTHEETKAFLEALASGWPRK